MKDEKRKKKLDYSDRVAIETQLCRKGALNVIADKTGHHRATIAREIKENRSFVPGNHFNGNDCELVRDCTESHLCGVQDCMMFCRTCEKDCHRFCAKYHSVGCDKVNAPPYVCNACSARQYCSKDRYFYSARMAEARSKKRRSDSRKGIRVTDEELGVMDAILVEQVKKKGQPLSHVLSSFPDEFVVGLRSVYNYIDQGAMSVRNIDLRRKARYKKRRKKHVSGIEDQHYRSGRTYNDFKAYIEGKSSSIVTEMDTVKGPRGQGQVLLTMILRRNSVMLLFIMPDCRQESVLRWLDYLETGLGTDVFKRLFSVLLTDNGSEFKCADKIELTADLTLRTAVYYCDPMASWQKPHIEKNHEYIRYVIPKGKSLNPYTQQDITLLMNHINSIKRDSLGDRSPYELVNEKDTDMKALMKLMHMQEIPAEDVNLSPSLLEVVGRK